MAADGEVDAMVAAAIERSRLMQSDDPMDRIRGIIATFEAGCGNTIGGKPEDCPECVRTFVDALKSATTR